MCFGRLAGFCDDRFRPFVEREIFRAFLLSFHDVACEGVELIHQSRVMLVQDLCQGSERRIVAIAARHIGQVVRQIDPKLILPLFVHGHLHRLTLSQGTLAHESVSI